MDTIAQSIENIAALRKADEETIDTHSSFTPSREELLGLTFQKGQEVRDERTGKIYTVVAGTRKSIAVPTSRS